MSAAEDRRTRGELLAYRAHCRKMAKAGGPDKAQWTALADEVDARLEAERDDQLGLFPRAEADPLDGNLFDLLEE